MSFSWKNPMILATLQPSVTVAKGKISVATMTHGWGCGCDVVIHASFTKFTSPAKLFLNDDIFYFLKKNGDFSDFWGDEACREVS